MIFGLNIATSHHEVEEKIILIFVKKHITQRQVLEKTLYCN